MIIPLLHLYMVVNCICLDFASRRILPQTPTSLYSDRRERWKRRRILLFRRFRRQAVDERRLRSSRCGRAKKCRLERRESDRNGSEARSCTSSFPESTFLRGVKQEMVQRHVRALLRPLRLTHLRRSKIRNGLAAQLCISLIPERRETNST